MMIVVKFISTGYTFCICNYDYNTILFNKEKNILKSNNKTHHCIGTMFKKFVVEAET